MNKFESLIENNDYLVKLKLWDLIEAVKMFG